MKIFLIIFILAILFVVGSATAMRYFDNPPAKKKQENKTAEADEK
ncbi:MAG: hypothetical protein OEY29_14020 [Gammaproteobacteria bacterium]|nr:hypothetical protein [Gammaproteobacteria bacterium]